MFDRPAELDPQGHSGAVGTAGRLPIDRPNRWSPSNWPARWKLFVIAALPLLLAGVLGGLRIHAGHERADGLRAAADRAQMVPAVDAYMAAMESVLATNAADGATPQALSRYEVQRSTVEHRRRTAEPDVQQAVTVLLDDGRALLDQAAAHQTRLAQQATAYVSLLPAAQTAITGSVRDDGPELRVQAQGVSSAIASRGRLAMQRMLVERGGDLPEPELRSTMTAIAGGETDAVPGMARVLGQSSGGAATLRGPLDQRQSLLSDPAQPLVGNPDLLASIEATYQIAEKLIPDATASVTAGADDAAARARAGAVRDVIGVLAAVLIVLVIVLWVARALVRPLRRLRDGALRIAHGDLAKGIDLVKAGVEREPPPLPIHSTDEVGQVAHAVDELHVQALQLAVDETRLRAMVNDMFETMSRRNRSLVDQQLSLIDQLERNEEDPARLASLFRLDHLATRMRRTGDNLLVLADAASSRELADPMPVTDLVNAAASEVEEYQRIEIDALTDCTVNGTAATDSVHLIAELLDNALRYSPPTEPVRVRAAYVGSGGLLVEVHDAGLGMADSDLRMANMRLTSAGDVSPDSARHMGLFVAGRLARRHGMTILLRGGADGVGTAAQLYLPPGLLEGPPVPVAYHDPVRAVHPLTQSAQPGEAGWPPAEDDGIAAPPPWVEHDPDLAGAAASIESVAAEPEPKVAAVTPLPRREPGSSGIAVPTAESESTGTGPPDGGERRRPKSCPLTPPDSLRPGSRCAAPRRKTGRRRFRRRCSAENPEPSDSAMIIRYASGPEVATVQYVSTADAASGDPVERAEQAEQAGQAEQVEQADSGSVHPGEADTPAAGPPPRTGSSDDDLIYQNMVSEWLVCSARSAEVTAAIVTALPSRTMTSRVRLRRGTNNSAQF